MFNLLILYLLSCVCCICTKLNQLFVSVYQIDAHVGCVNDLAFAHPNKQMCVVTCGDDKLIKVRKASDSEFCLLFPCLIMRRFRCGN